MKRMTIPIIIPAYEPDARLLGLIDELNKSGIGPVIVVNDGSEGAEYKEIFEDASRRGARLLTHAVNMGKGRALKDAFNYCLNEYDDLLGVITADSDGQHTTEDIEKCKEALIQSGQDQALVLGCRNFNESGIPARSVFGNKTTSRVMKLLLGLSISDTQTGLRGISVPFMK